jgi:hypothetical protein
MNCKKMFVGGIVAGVWINLVEIVTNHVVLKDRYQSLTKMGFYNTQPQLYFMPVYPIMMLIGGILFAWLYAATRDTLGPGPKTALKVGFVIFLIAGIPSNYAMAAWSTTGKFIPFVYTIACFFECVFGTLIAGALYKPKA